MKYRLILFILSLGLFSNCLSSDWVAPKNPDPETILTEAIKDLKNQKYEEALLKHIWIHEHSLEHKASFSGLRISSAIEAWYDLGEKHPLAREKYYEYRDKAKQKVMMQNEDIFYNFGDFQAFNEVAEKQDEIIDLFYWIGKNKPSMIYSVYPFVIHTLIDADRYDILNKYIRPIKDYKNAEKDYTDVLEYQAGRDNKKVFEALFINDVRLLVTILKKNNRLKEAQEIILKASLLIKDPKLKDSLETPLTDSM